jgi:hypothetical protein
MQSVRKKGIQIVLTVAVVATAVWSSAPAGGLPHADEDFGPQPAAQSR